MKKIGILSYFNYYNYGSMLQGFALQYYIRSLGYDIDCELINYRGVPPTNSSKWRKIITRISRLGYNLSLIQFLFSVFRRYFSCLILVIYHRK